ncbi:hypothetical protein [Streptosporangium sp. NPDC002524]|uniref:hypothetical protein n=1 Tax=Streptosporangium sp. NPDC002524 TaxID=3154537 RepID=UPI003331D545
MLPGITTLAPLVTNVRAEQPAAVNDHLVKQTPVQMRRELLETLVVPASKKVSPLEWMRTAVALVSGAGVWDFSQALAGHHRKGSMRREDVPLGRCQVSR